MPKPNKDESEKDFIERCTTELIDNEGREPKQAAAICHSIWNEHKGGTEENKKMSEKNKRILFRSDISRGIQTGKSGVDRAGGIIKGFAVISKGEAIGHDAEVDEITLAQTLEHGNKSEVGIKSRFGHPNMSSEALGTFLGRVKNFYLDGGIVRADLYLDSTAYKTPNGDLANYVLDLAEGDPAAFGASIVFDGEMEYRLNEDGTKKKDKNDKPLLPLMRIKKLWAVDTVDEPAANNSMFGAFFSETVKPSAEMTAFLNKFLGNPDAVEKVISFLQRYSVNQVEVIEKQKPKEEGKEKMELKMIDLTLEQLKAQRGDLATALIAEGKEAGIKLERERVSAILKSRKEFSKYAIDSICEKMINDGADAKDVVIAFQKEGLVQLEKNTPVSLAAGNPNPEEEIRKSDFGADWENSKELQAEFPDVKNYISFRKAETSGFAEVKKDKK